MPPWNQGELPAAPQWNWRRAGALLGPGVVTAGAAIGGGEWLMGPVNTARYGGAILWVTTLSILGQVIYNMEICRYTLYTGEPIMTGKFRTFPGPTFWLIVYLGIDLGSLIPYQTASMATPVFALAEGTLPRPDLFPAQTSTLTLVGCGLILLTALPLIVSGRIYRFMKAMMAVKVVVVFAFLLLLGVLYASAETWTDIATGFFKVGTVPVRSASGAPVLDNVFLSLFRGDGWPDIDPASIASLAAYAAIAGIGGLKSSTTSNYTRDQGWGMGAAVGAIPSILGAGRVQVSHVGTVFTPTVDSIVQWRGWLRHVTREQLCLFLMGSMIGVALPAMLAVEFLPRGTEAGNWAMAGLTAGGIEARVGGVQGRVFWYAFMACGLLVLLPNTTFDADGTVRRWVDLAWTGSSRLRQWPPSHIGRFYFIVLVGYLAMGIGLSFVTTPRALIQIYGLIANFALGFSCFHTLAVNLTLLPPPLRPGWGRRALLAAAGLYFTLLTVITLASYLGVLR
jgi:hypothetical protein